MTDRKPDAESNVDGSSSREQPFTVGHVAPSPAGVTAMPPVSPALSSTSSEEEHILFKPQPLPSVLAWDPGAPSLTPAGVSTDHTQGLGGDSVPSLPSVELHKGNTKLSHSPHRPAPSCILSCTALAVVDHVSVPDFSPTHIVSSVASSGSAAVPVGMSCVLHLFPPITLSSPTRPDTHYYMVCAAAAQRSVFSSARGWSEPEAAIIHDSVTSNGIQHTDEAHADAALAANSAIASPAAVSSVSSAAPVTSRPASYHEALLRGLSNSSSGGGGVTGRHPSDTGVSSMLPAYSPASSRLPSTEPHHDRHGSDYGGAVAMTAEHTADTAGHHQGSQHSHRDQSVPATRSVHSSRPSPESSHHFHVARDVRDQSAYSGTSAGQSVIYSAPSGPSVLLASAAAGAGRSSNLQIHRPNLHLQIPVSQQSASPSPGRSRRRRGGAGPSQQTGSPHGREDGEIDDEDDDDGDDDGDQGAALARSRRPRAGDIDGRTPTIPDRLPPSSPTGSARNLEISERMCGGWCCSRLRQPRRRTDARPVW